MSLFSVYLFRIKYFCSHYITVKGPVEAGDISRVTGSTLLLHEEYQAVLIAVGEDVYYFLEVPALFTFFQSFFLLLL